MKKTLITIALFSIPFVSHAAWWNNFKGFFSPEPKIVEKIVEIPVEKIVEKIVEKPVEKIVVKTVDNPELAKTIAELRTQISTLQGELNRCRTVPVSQFSAPIQDNSFLKVEQCKADRDAFRARLDAQIPSLVEAAYRKCVDNNLEQMKSLFPPGSIDPSAFSAAVSAPCKNKERNAEIARSSFEKEANERYQVCINK